MIFDLTNIKTLNGRRSVGVDLFFNQQDEPVIYFVESYEHKGKVIVSKCGTCPNPDELYESISENLPLYLSIDGKYVIHKLIDNSNDGKELENILPDARKDEFFVQKINVGKDKSFISVIRQDKLDSIVSGFREHNIFIFNLFLGPVSSFNLIVNTSNTDDFKLPNYNLLIEGGQIVDISKIPNSGRGQDFSVEDESLKLEYLIPFANSICHFYKANDDLPGFVLAGEQRESFLYKRLFHLTGWFAISLFFLLLLANYLVFSGLRDKNQSLTGQVESNKELIKIIQQKQTLLKAREELISKTSYSNVPLFSYYSDRIAKIIPPQISLVKIELLPQEKTTDNKDGIKFLHDRIVISGITSGSAYLDTWIKSLNKYIWISDIVITSYFKGNQEPANFDLEIFLNNDK